MIWSVATGNLWRGPVKLHSILSFHWSTPLVSCSNCSHHGTKSCCGLGSYRDGVFSHLLSGQKQSQTWMTASQDNSLHQLSVQTSKWRSCSHRREGSVPAMVKRVKSDDQAVLHWQAHRWCWKRSEVIVIMIVYSIPTAVIMVFEAQLSNTVEPLVSDHPQNQVVI